MIITAAAPTVTFPDTPDLARIDSLIDWAARHPDEHDQSNYSNIHEIDESIKHPCGTAFCLAGRVVREDELAGLITVDWFNTEVRPIDGVLFPLLDGEDQHRLPMGEYAAARLGIDYWNEGFRISGFGWSITRDPGLFDTGATIETMRATRNLIALRSGQPTKPATKP